MYICAVKFDLKNWVLLISLSCIWGSSFILMKKGMHTDSGEPIFNDTQVAALRMLFASVVLTPFAIYFLKKLKSKKDLLLLAVAGFSGNFFPAYLFTYAETGISSGYTGMLNSFTPIFALVIGFIIFKNRLTTIQVLGVIIGTIGIILLSIAGHNLSVQGTMWHIAAVVLATLFYAISLNTIKFTLQHYSGIMITSIAFFLVLIPSIVSNWWSGTWSTINSNPHASEGLLFIGILSVLGTALAVYLFSILISRASVLFSSSVTYLIPIVAVLIGLLYGERINVFQIVSMLVILTGIFVANIIPILAKNSLFAKKDK